MRPSHVLLVASVAACAGGGGFGYHVMPMRMGALYTSKGDTCAIRFENLSFLEASSKYEQLGMVTLTGTGGTDFTDPMKHDVEREACKMGADVVSLNGSTPGMIQFLVWRAR
jgi:hypothetical protein